MYSGVKLLGVGYTYLLDKVKLSFKVTVHRFSAFWLRSSIK